MCSNSLEIFMGRDRRDAAAFRVGCRLSRAERALMKKKLVSLFLTLLTILSLFPTAAFAAESTGVGITPVTDPNLWTTRLTASGQTYSYRPPTAAGRQLYCMDLGYSYRYGTESFLKSYTYRSCHLARMLMRCGTRSSPRPAWVRWMRPRRRTSSG